MTTAAAIERRERRSLAPAHIVGFAVLASIFAKSMAEKLAEHDLWWHLKTGQIIVATHHVLRADPFSFTVPGKSWVDGQWLSEVVMRGVQATSGLRGIIVWRSVMLVATYAVVAWLLVEVGGNRLATWAIIALASYAGVPAWIERPILFSFLIFAVVLTMTLRRSSRIWWLVPLFALWANLHGLFILGLGYLFVLTAAETFKASRGKGDHAWARRLDSVTLVCLLATFLNPYGPKLLTYSLGLVKTVSQTASEWASPNFHESLTYPFLLLALLVLASLALSEERPDLTDVVLAIVFLGLGLYAERNLPVSGMVLGYVCVRYTPSAVRAALRLQRARTTSAINPAVGVLAIVLVAAVLAVGVWHRFPKSDALTAVADPALPVATIASLPDSGVHLFIDDRWAGLAIYMKWPGTHVAFDGRGDVYGSAIIGKFEKTISGGIGWETWLRQICPTHVLIEENGGLANVIERSPDWRVVRRDPIAGGTAVLLVPSGRLAGCPA
ncbi:MAG TPA: hypothetical protein VJ818_06150 [Actinomycetota bacterium]|nr:hypothetical protein [Actinomycetota bacterium]